MNIPALVREIAEKTPAHLYTTIAESDNGIMLCIDHRGHWYEGLLIARVSLEGCSFDKVLQVFLLTKKYVVPTHEDRTIDAFARRVYEYLQANKQRLTEELTETLKKVNEATSHDKEGGI